MAREWARELGKQSFRGHEQIVAQETAHGFAEVEKGRHPDTVLREILSRIEERICQSNGLTAVPTAGISLKSH
jgi:hypothetical protein